MAAVTVCSDFWRPKKKIYHCFPFFSFYLPWSDGTRWHDLWFLNVEFKVKFFILLFHHQEALFSSSLSAIRVVSSTYLRLLIFFLIPTSDSSSLAFHTMQSVYKLNKQGDNIQPYLTPFPILNQSVVSCNDLTVASWPAYRFLRRQVRCSGIPISLRIFHSLLWSTQSKALT